MAISTTEELQIVLRETDIPFFTENELTFYLKKNNGDYDATAYECLMVKAQNTSLSISGLTAADSSSYFRRLAAQYKPRNSGTLKGVY